MTVKEIFPHPLSVHSYLLRIRIGSTLYLESGVLDVLQIAPLNEDSYRPAQLYFDSGLSSYASSDKAFMGEISVTTDLSITYDPPLEEGQSETGVGFKEGDMSSIAVGTFVGTLSSTTVTFRGLEDEFRQSIQNRKKAQIHFPASTFGGKMRQYVQSIYGSKRTDYSYTKPLAGEAIAGTLTIDGQDYNPYRSSSSHWIYTTDEYEYFLMEESSSGVTAKKMELSAVGKRLRRWLLANPQGADETRKVEGYMLSTTSLGDAVTVAESSDIAPANDHGSPVIYGWHFNMNGTEGQVVTIKAIDTHSAEATHLKMLVSLNTNKKDIDEDYWRDQSNWSFTVSVEEGPTEFTLGQGDLMWKADLLFPGMDKVVVSELGDPMIDANVPLYVVYNYVGDEFSAVRHKRESNLTDIGKNVASSSDVGTLESEGGCNFWTSASSANLRGFFVEGSSEANGTGHDASSVTANSVEVRLGEFLGCVGGESQYLCFGGGAEYNGDIEFTTICTISVGDLDTVFIGGKEHFDGDVDWLNGTLGGTPHIDAGWNPCSGGSPVGDHEIDWLDPFFPAGNQRGSFVSRLRQDGLNNGTAAEGDLTDVEWDTIWVVHWHNGTALALHEDQSSSDAGGVSGGIYMPSCLQARPFTELAQEGSGFPEGTLSQGGWELHFTHGQNEPENNANSAKALSNLTGDYFATNMEDGGWETNSYNDISENTYLTFVGHD